MGTSKLFFRKTNRLVVRPFELKDYQAWKQVFSTMHPKKDRFDLVNRTPQELTVAKFKAVLKSQAEKRKTEQFFDYGVFEKKTGVLVGQIGIGNFVRSVTQSAFLGYSLSNRYRGFGYAHEAVNALIDMAFRDHKLHRLVAGIEPENKKSHQVIRKLGFRKEGLSKRVVFIRGDWQDLVQYALTCEDRGIKWQRHHTK